MSTPEDVAARLTECLDDEWAPLEGGMLRTLVPSWLVRATAAELASQRERLERERDEAFTRGQEAMREAVCKLPNANVYAIHLVSVEAVRSLSPTTASAKTAEDRG